MSDDQDQDLRRFQFSLRTLLLGVLLAAIAISLIATEYHKAEEDQRIILKIQEVGGAIRLDHDGYDVSLKGRQCDDSILQLIAGLHKVVRLSILHCAITNDGLAYLDGVTSLHGLVIVTPGVSDLGLEHISKLTNLEHLTLSGQRFTDAGLECLTNLHNLAILEMYYCNVSDDEIARLKYACQR